MSASGKRKLTRGKPEQILQFTGFTARDEDPKWNFRNANETH